MRLNLFAASLNKEKITFYSSGLQMFSWPIFCGPYLTILPHEFITIKKKSMWRKMPFETFLHFSVHLNE